MFTAFVCVEKKQPVRFQPADFLIKYIWGECSLLFHAESLLSYHGSISEDINMISSGRQIFFYIPIYGYILFFSGVFYVFLDGINQTTVFVWECV